MGKLFAVRRFASDDREPCKVAEGLYLGSIGAACNLAALKQEGVRHVLNASPLVPCFHRRVLTYSLVSVYDDPSEDIAQHFLPACTFIEEGRREGGVLVHCFAGQSRSVTLVVAYLMKAEQMTLSEALLTVKSVRPLAAPNSGFLRQLERFAADLGQPLVPLKPFCLAADCKSEHRSASEEADLPKLEWAVS